MKREHIFEEKSLPDPLYYFPLTENTDDMTGNFTGWTTDNLTQFSGDGAYFNGTNKLLKTPTGKTFGDFKTFSFKMKLPNLLNDVHMLMYIRSTSSTNINLIYSPSWNQDINFSVYVNGSSSAGSVARIPFVENTEYTITIRQDYESNLTDLFVNGSLLGTARKCVPATSSISEFEMGYRYNNNDRFFIGYIKDFVVFDAMLTDEQIKEL